MGRILDKRKRSLEKNESKSHASKKGKYTVQQDGVDAKMGGDLSVVEQRI